MPNYRSEEKDRFSTNGFRMIFFGIGLMIIGGAIVPDCYYSCVGCLFGEDTANKFLNIAGFVLMFVGMFMYVIPKKEREKK